MRTNRKKNSLIISILLAAALLLSIVPPAAVHAGTDTSVYELTITVKDQTYVYNGWQQGEGDPVYDDPAVIAEKVTVEGLVGNDMIASLVLDGAETDIGEYPGRIEITGFSISNGAGDTVTDNYKVTLVPGKLTITSPVTLAVEGITCGQDETITVTIPTDFTGTIKITVTDPDKKSAEYEVEITEEMAGEGTLTLQDLAVGEYTVTGEYASDSSTAVSASFTVSHDMKEVKGAQETCTEDGNKPYYTCSGCGKWFTDSEGENEITDHNEVVIPAKGHQPGEIVIENEKAATCTEDGSHDEAVYCSVCGEEISRETVTDKTTGHSWGEWKQTKAPTEEEAGEEERICENDPSHKETREIAPIVHIHNMKEVKGAQETCTEDGNKPYYTCIGCGRWYIDSAGENEITDHDEVVIPAKGHQPGEPVIENEKAATCTEDGSHDEAVYCSVCGEEISRETVTDKATGHSWGEWKQTKASTEEEAGEEERICENDPSHKETRKVDPLGHIHALTRVPEAKATIEKRGNKEYYTCSGCGKWFRDSEGKEEIKDKNEIYLYWFPDVSDPAQPYFEPVYWAAGNDIVRGYKNGMFGPDDSCTREQFVVMLWRMKGRPASDAKIIFTDVDSSMSTYSAIRWAAGKGIILGFKDGSFKPSNTITRQQAAIMFWRLSGRPSVSASVRFSDVTSETSGHKAIQWGQEAGIIKGYEDNTFRPEEDCLRKHIVIFFYRYARDVLRQNVG